MNFGLRGASVTTTTTTTITTITTITTEIGSNNKEREQIKALITAPTAAKQGKEQEPDSPV